MIEDFRLALRMNRFALTVLAYAALLFVVVSLFLIWRLNLVAAGEPVALRDSGAAFRTSWAQLIRNVVDSHDRRTGVAGRQPGSATSVAGGSRRWRHLNLIWD